MNLEFLDFMNLKNKSIVWWIFIGIWWVPVKFSFYLTFIAWWYYPYKLIYKNKKDEQERELERERLALQLEKGKQLKEKNLAKTHCDRCGNQFRSEYDKDVDYDYNKALCKSCVIDLEEIELKKMEIQQQSPKNNISLVENKQEKIIRCPKCGSTQLHAGKKPLSIKRAVVGTLLVNPVGGVIGALTSKKLIVTCMSCGHYWKAGKVRAK